MSHRASVQGRSAGHPLSLIYKISKVDYPRSLAKLVCQKRRYHRINIWFSELRWAIGITIFLAKEKGPRAEIYRCSRMGPMRLEILSETY